jgi:hypothetical protein
VALQGGKRDEEPVDIPKPTGKRDTQWGGSSVARDDDVPF